MSGRIARVVCVLALLGTAVASRLQDMRQVTCPDGFEECAGRCYQSVDTSCSAAGRGLQRPAPKTQEEINCLLEMSAHTDLPVRTSYENFGDSFASLYSFYEESAPEELVGEPGPGGEYDEDYVVINRESKKLVRSAWLGSDGFAYVCEPLE